MIWNACSMTGWSAEMIFDQGKLEKMILRAYKPVTGAGEVPQISDAPEDSYVVQVNPSSYAIQQTIEYSDNQAQGTKGNDGTFAQSPPREMSFTFLFDATGVVPPPPTPLTGIPIAGAIAAALTSEDFVISDEIDKFNHVVYDYVGEVHRPRRILLLWGALGFTCVLTAVTFDFKLFRPDGTPLRATAACTFREAIPDSQRVLEEANSSPDLTHLRQVRDGDRLPLLAQEIYGDPRHYLALARHNGLVNFRKLQPGTDLQLPRLDGEARR
jgi:hypothetical protein